MTTSRCGGYRSRLAPTFETPGFIVEQPELYSEFTQFDAGRAGGRPRRLRSRSRHVARSCARCSRRSSSPTRWPTRRSADGVDIDDREAFREAIGSVEDFYLLGYQPVSCAGNVAEYESICQRKTNYSVWDGETFTPDADIPEGFIDVTELLLAVEEAAPRQ